MKSRILSSIRVTGNHNLARALVALSVAGACLLFGCSQPQDIPNTPNALPPSLLIDNVLYYYTGEEVPVEIDEASIMGIVTSTVPLSEMPIENGQSNMTPILGCSYAPYEGNFVVLIEEEWMLFEARDID